MSLIELDGVAKVLPIAEMVFERWDENRPRIVGYAAKWNETAAEYRDTVRVFGWHKREHDLKAELEGLARECWALFGLTGYARVDFRVDADGQPFILEVNPNPCLEPNAGLAASSREAGLTYDALIDHICVQRFVVDSFRNIIREQDAADIERLVRLAGVFNPAEVAIARELVEEHLAKGEQASGYSFLFADGARGVDGYSCYGPVPGTNGRFELLLDRR